MNETTDINYPFKTGLSEKKDITEGSFSEIKQFQDDDRWVVKEYSQVMDFALGEWEMTAKKDSEKVGLPPEMTWNRFKEQIKKDDDLLNRFGKGLRKFIPDHHLVFGANDKGEKRGFVAMKRVLGEDVEKMAQVPEGLIEQLEELITESVEFYRQSNLDPISKGLFPDLLPIQEDDNLRFGNLMWGKVGDREGLFLTDIYPLRHFSDPDTLAMDLGIM